MNDQDQARRKGEIASYLNTEWGRHGVIKMKGFQYETSPFFAGDPIQAIPQRLLFVVGEWDDVLPHLGMFAAAKSGLRMPDVKVLTDLHIIETKYGRQNDELFSQSISVRGLLVLRLGFQQTRNEELPSIVWEACRVRESRRLPMVLVNEPVTPWGAGHRAWSAGLASYLEAKFHKVEIPSP